MTTTQPVAPEMPAPTPPQKPAGRERRRRDDLQPFVPPWMRSMGELFRKVDDALWYPVLKVRNHLAPWNSLPHVLTVLRYAPRGAWRDLVWMVAWMRYWQNKFLLDQATDTGDAKTFKEQEAIARRYTRHRWRNVLGATVVTLFVLWLQLWLTSDWSPQVPWMVWWWPSSPVQLPWLLWLPWPSWALLAGAVVWWGYRGRPDDKPMFKPVTVTSTKGMEDLNDNIVLRALCSLGIAGMKDPAQIELLYGVKPTRAGYNIDLILPRGIPATAVMAKRAELSAALRRPIGCVWPSVGPQHEGHLVLFVSHEDMSAAKQKPWPLLKSGAVNVFQPVPMFTDQQGDWVELRLATTCGLVGAVPRMGKTFFQRELSLVGALDVRVEEYVFELKGTGDLSCAKLYAHYYSDSDEEEDIAEHLIVMRNLVKERRRRSRVIKSLPDERCPRSEVTDELASDPKLGLHPILIEADECQVWFMHLNREIRDEFALLADDLVRKGPAVGIMAYFSTQELGKDSIPPSVRRNASVRLCFKVNDAEANNKVLGPGSYANGYQATMFDFYKDKGIAYLRSEGPPQIVRTVASMDKVEADKVAFRAHNMRKQAGRLTGMAAGQDILVEAEEVQLIDALRQVVGTAKAASLAGMAAGLAERHPGMYGPLDADGLGKLLRGMTPPIEPGPVWVPGEGSCKGIKREQLDVATTSETAADGPRDNVRQFPMDR